MLDWLLRLELQGWRSAGSFCRNGREAHGKDLLEGNERGKGKEKTLDADWVQSEDIGKVLETL